MRLHLLRQVGLVLIAFALAWPAAGELHPKFLFGHDAQPGEEMILLNDFRMRYMRAVFEAYETESFEDDEAVIQQMLAGVEQFYVVEDTGQRYYVIPDVQARAYRESIIMARASEGQELLVTDLQLAAQRALPLHRWFQEVPPFELYEAWYEQADPAERQAHAGGYIGLLVDRSLAQERAGEIADALVTTRTAREVARDTDSEWAPIVQARERQLRVVDREMRRIRQYEERVASGEANDEVLHALALWRLLFKGDAEAALGFAQQANDEALQTRLSASMQAADGRDAAEALAHLRKRYEGRGVQVVKIEDAWAIRTSADLGFLMQKETVEVRKLSRAAIETLAIVAYHQPATRAEIEEIRGVSVSRGTIDQLIEMEWIRFGRRRMTPGRPVTFVVTDGFLDHFGLENARDLPGLKELRAAGLLENRPPPGTPLDAPELDEDTDQPELFEDEA